MSETAASAPPLARASIDRAAQERDDPSLLDRLRDDPRTRVVLIDGDTTPVGDGGQLVTVRPDVVSEEGVDWAFLGRGADSEALLVAALPSGSVLTNSVAGQWTALRALGGEVSAVDAAIFVEAVTLARWLRDARFCPTCGAALVMRMAGWARWCDRCSREHYPRTDPAVIVAVVSSDGQRLLLGQNAMWRERNMYSTFAGFVEAGESLEAALAREIEEEAGVRVTHLEYRGSQPWPYPRSLMLGFRARSVDDAAARPDGEEIVSVRWFTRTEIRDAYAGRSDIRLPGNASIAHQLITDWCAEDAQRDA